MDNKQEKNVPRGFSDQIFFAESQLDFSPWQVGLTILHKKKFNVQFYNNNRIYYSFMSKQT